MKDDKLSSKVLPDEKELEAAYQKVAGFWDSTLHNVSAYKEYLELTRNDKPVSTLREENLLFKPVTQMALAHVALLAQRKGLKWSTLVSKLNRINWAFDNELWYNILVIGSANKKMITGKESIRGAGMVISYMIMGNRMTKAELDDVRQIIQNARNNDSADMPEMV